jgi:hypothetical protein
LCFVDGFDVLIEIPLVKKPAFKDALYSSMLVHLRSDRGIDALAEFCSKYDLAFERYNMMAAYKRTKALSSSAAAAEPVKGYRASTAAQRNIDSMIEVMPSIIKANLL